MPPPRPKALGVAAENIPALLRDRPNWVCWKYALRQDRWTKLPLRPDGRPARVDDRTTWVGFQPALEAYRARGFDGVGFVLDGEAVTGDGLVIAGVDIDKLNASAEFGSRAYRIVRRFDAYTERSPSGNGLRIFCLAKPLAKGVSRGGVEAYTSGRYLTVTGQTVDGIND